VRQAVDEAGDDGVGESDPGEQRRRLFGEQAAVVGRDAEVVVALEMALKMAVSRGQ
jgi:hypothetical protein